MEANIQIDGLAELAGAAHDVRDARILQVGLRRAQLLRCALRGLTAKAASRIVGCSESTACAVYRDPEFRRSVYNKFNSVFEDIDAGLANRKLALFERIEHKASDAFSLLEDLMDSDETPVHLRARIAQDMLDRNPQTQAGHIVTRRSEELSQMLQEASKAAGEVDKVVQMRRSA